LSIRSDIALHILIVIHANKTEGTPLYQSSVEAQLSSNFQCIQFKPSIVLIGLIQFVVVFLSTCIKRVWAGGNYYDFSLPNVFWNNIKNKAELFSWKLK